MRRGTTLSQALLGCVVLALGAGAAASTFSIDGVTLDGGTDLELDLTLEPDSGLDFTGDVTVTAGVITGLTFKWLATGCGVSGSLDFKLNGTLLDSAPSPANCTCGPGLSTRVIPLGTFSPLLVAPPGQNTFEVVQDDPTASVAFAWVYADLETDAGPRRIELADRSGGPSYDNLDLCASGYNWGSFTATSDVTLADPLTLNESWDDAPPCAFDLLATGTDWPYLLSITADDGNGPPTLDTVGFQRTTETTLLPSVCRREQGPEQYRCMNGMNRETAAYQRRHQRTGLACLDNLAKGRTERLGWLQTGQSCLETDVGGRMARQVARYSIREARACRARPEQLPEWAYSDGATVMGWARSHDLGLVADLFGADLDAAAIPRATDRVAATCQREVLRRTQRSLDALWKEALAAKRRILATKSQTPAYYSFKLQQGIFDALAANVKGPAVKAAARLASLAQKRCSQAAPPIATLFPGLCAGSADLDALATCANEAARCRFCLSLNAADALAHDCDLFDDGVADASCP